MNVRKPDLAAPTSDGFGRPNQISILVMVPVLTILLMGALAACGSNNSNSDSDAGWGPDSGSDASDISDSGQIAYACALADHIHDEHGDADSWSDTIGENADPGVRESAAVSSLLGGTAGFTLPDHKELSAHAEDIAKGITQLDIEALQSGLDGVIEDCQDISGTADADVSHSAQLTYACNLIDHVRDEHGDDAESWGSIDDDTAWHEAISAAALAGSLNGQELPDHKELSQAGKDIYTGASSAEPDVLNNGLKDFASACDAT